MDDKNTNIFFSDIVISINSPEANLKPLKVVESSSEWDKFSVREKMEIEPLRVKPIQFEHEMPIDRIAPIVGFDDALEPYRCSLIIQSEPKINTPRNLKYPNKKRARRVWKKWKQRFGTRPGESICLPNMEINSDGDGVNFTAKPIK